MRGGVHLLLSASLTLLLIAQTSEATTFRCSDRSPEGRITPKGSSEDKFQIKISGNPSSYVPGEKYQGFSNFFIQSCVVCDSVYYINIPPKMPIAVEIGETFGKMEKMVTLQGVKHYQTAQKFTAFFLTVHSADDIYGNDKEGRHRDVGYFQTWGDALSQISETCPNAVTQTSSAYKSEIQVFWNAPTSGSGCVVFRATVVENRYVWYMDDGGLSLNLCENMQENINEQLEVLEKCCACDEAKYEVTFEGLWSRHTHPKDFPSNGWLTRFSDIIGASHSSEYRFWQYGDIASEGLRQVAETGSTRMLESELKSESEHIRTIIKARGISYPNVTGKTFAVFRVDKKHHLMSLVSMIDPSPDWIVGVSGLELCLKNCSWIEFRVLNLYPWDAGTDSGVSYISPDSPTSPRDPIRQITTRFPKDEASPFYDPSGAEMKPFAKLYLTRQRLYEKSCSDDSIGSEAEEINQDCAVTEWSDWGPCSVTCGRGVRHRQRFYLDSMQAEAKSCVVKLSSRMSCYGKRRICRDYADKSGEDVWRSDPTCQVTEWSDWSPCSATCGQAVKTRSRKYLIRSAKKKCALLPGAQELQQTLECAEVANCYGEEENDDGEENENCPVTPWSEWSPCSATCGSGTKTRTRKKLREFNHYLLDYEDYEGDPCADVSTTQNVQCEADLPNCEPRLEEAKQICHLPADPGPCRAHVERWYFDAASETCKTFIYRGCKGNANSFYTRDECEQQCSLLKDYTQYTRDQFNGLKPGNQIININSTYGLPNTISTPMTIEEIYGEKINCKTSPWTQWSKCSETCGRGIKEKSRDILIYPQNGGRPCPQKLIKRRKCKIQNCENSRKEDGETYPSWGDTRKSENESRDCILSEWSQWSSCSATCGTGAVRQRTKVIIQTPGLLGRGCPPRIETISCNLLPCTY